MKDESSSKRLGRYVESTSAGERVRAFLPPPLPPDPPLDISVLLERLVAAERALGRLDGVSTLLPDHDLFLYMYVRKEALLSSQIEGTQSTLTDLLAYEGGATNGPGLDDVREVSNYVDAMAYGLDRLETLPISLRLIKELHERLLHCGRGEACNPGEFRSTQNWIGGTRPGNATYVPPPANEVQSCLADLETFVHTETPDIPPLLKAGLIHVQFETIHPFLDGNGRLGRLLITLYLCSQKVLREPLLYLSLYFKTYRKDYYRLLQEVRERGAWEAWLEFFLEGVAATAEQAFDTASRLAELFKHDRELIEDRNQGTVSALRVHGHMQAKAFGHAKQIAESTGLSMPTVNKALEQLQALGIIYETTGKKRDRTYAYGAYLEILKEGTQPIGREG